MVQSDVAKCSLFYIFSPVILFTSYTESIKSFDILRRLKSAWICSSALCSNILVLTSLTGGLQHVTYTHSNQKIVGSSRAEDRLSRAAVRDVFELNKHSQIPANQLLDSSEVSTSFIFMHCTPCSLRVFAYGISVQLTIVSLYHFNIWEMYFYINQ